jgi:hypothetical protein
MRVFVMMSKSHKTTKREREREKKGKQKREKKADGNCSPQKPHEQTTGERVHLSF